MTDYSHHGELKSMFERLKSMFGWSVISEVEDVARADPPMDEAKLHVKKTPAIPAGKVKKTKKSTGKACDFDKLTKPQLLAEAKKRSIKATSGMNKAALLAAVKAAK